MTEPIRLLHFADVHIGMENYGRTDPATGVSSRVVDFLRCMDEMIVYARDHEVDLAIFAGDAFKSRSPSPTFQREFAFRVQDLAENARSCCWSAITICHRLSGVRPASRSMRR